MSAGYAGRLKEYPHKGVCGLPETVDTQRALACKIQKLVDWIQSSSSIVVLTGAGISTSAGIPDFRGPNGIWTLEKKKKRKRMDDAPEASIDFGKARPTLTHRALTKLVKEGIVDFVITQNVDGLHRRSGLSRHSHAVLHGCAFTEKCEDCGTEYFRDFDIGGMSFQKTGRFCGCGGALRDTLLDWEDPLPEDDLERAENYCEKADLALCLGTSLRIEPAGSLPTKAKRYVIVNLQETPKDDRAALIIRCRCDDVLQTVMDKLGLEDWQDAVPDIERVYRPPKSVSEEPSVDDK